MKTNKIVKKTVYSALFAALAFVATVCVHISIPGVNGAYINFGDCIVFASGIILGPLYGGLAAGIGSAFADAFYGAWIYVPGTFVIKMLMAVMASVLYKALSKNKKDYHFIPLSVSSIVSELIMVFGYFLYEGIIYGFAASIISIPFNLIQAGAGIVVSVVLLVVMKKTKIVNLIKF